MRMFNADGSEAEMCGNGVRCVAKYVYDHGIARKDELKIETGRGVLTLELDLARRQGRPGARRYGRADFESVPRFPTTLAGRSAHSSAAESPGHELKVTCVSMGNPHCVTFVDEIDRRACAAASARRSRRHPAFPQAGQRRNSSKCYRAARR